MLQRIRELDRKFWLTLVVEIIIAFGIFIAASEWQASDMLETKTQVPSLTAPRLESGSMTLPGDIQSPQALVYFFAPWCSICDLSIGNLNHVKSQYGDQVDIIIVALDYRSVAEVEDFLADHELDFPVLLGTSDWMRAYRIKGFPSYYLLDRSGAVLSRSMGYSSSVGMLGRVALNK